MTSPARRSRTLIPIFVGLALIAGGAVYAGLSLRGDAPPLAAGEVRPEMHNEVTSSDGSVVVEIPAGAISSPGRLEIERLDPRRARAGWVIELDGTELEGEATIRFQIPDLGEGEPAPLVTSSRRERGRRTITTDVELQGKEAVVQTDHFSFWFLDRWSESLATATGQLSEAIDAAASVSPDRAPKCEGEDEVRADGLEVTSDAGRRAYWCLGLLEGSPVLKVLNARRYGVVAEYTPGLSVTHRDAGSLVDTVAGLLTPSATLQQNTTALLGPASRMEFEIDAEVRRAGVMLQPDPGAYLLSALQYAVDTFVMVSGKARVGGVADKLLTALKGEECLLAFAEMATTELATVQEAQEFFGSALETALDCVSVAAEDVDLGPVTDVVVQPAVWVMTGLGTAADGLVAASDLVMDVDGYQIIVERAGIDITEESVGDLLIPAGTCGDGDGFGWDQDQPIQLSGGEGESFDAENRGAGILDTELVGAVDVTGDGIDEAVVALTCTGSPKELCCAGRASVLDYVAVLDLTDSTPRRVGNTITPTDARGPGGSDEVRSFDGSEVALEGAVVVTQQSPIYPNLPLHVLRDLEGEVRYQLVGDRWVPTES